MNKLFKHLKTIHIHRKYVRQNCFKMGLFWQGLVHDLSKYSITELKIYKYYTGKKSPHQTCREQLGYSPSWIHHYHKNKHHYQFWIDESESGEFIPIKMPYKYVIENFCDMLGASKAYNLNNWKPQMLVDYWEQKCEGKRLMHADSIQLVKSLIYTFNKLKSEKEFFTWYRHNKKYLKNKYEHYAWKNTIYGVTYG